MKNTNYDYLKIGWSYNSQIRFGFSWRRKSWKSPRNMVSEDSIWCCIWPSYCAPSPVETQYFNDYTKLALLIVVGCSVFCFIRKSSAKVCTIIIYYLTVLYDIHLYQCTGSRLHFTHKSQHAILSLRNTFCRTHFRCILGIIARVPFYRYPYFSRPI